MHQAGFPGKFFQSDWQKSRSSNGQQVVAQLRDTALLKTAFILAWLFLAAGLRAQFLDSSFNPLLNGPVLALAPQPDGKVVIVGNFTMVNGAARNHMARLNADGTLDTGFNPGALRNTSMTHALNLQPDSKILFGGSYSGGGGFFDRCLLSGTWDAGFSYGSAPYYVGSITLQPDGRILVGRGRPPGAPQGTSLARHLTNGIIDTSFAAASLGLDPVAVDLLVLQSDGRILLPSSGGLVRLNTNGTRDNTYSSSTIDGGVRIALIQPDGKLHIAGSFNTIGGTACTNVGRLLTNGSFDSTFVSTLNRTSFVSGLLLQADGKVIVAANVGSNQLIRMNTNGVVDPTFGVSGNSGVYALGFDGMGRLLVGGYFTNLNGTARSYLARFGEIMPSSQGLGITNGNVRWLRSGSIAEFSRTTFEVSDLGINWTNLGLGTRIPGGWVTTDGSLGAAGLIRARGTVALSIGGTYNSAGYFLEALLTNAVPPQISLQPASTNQFGGLPASLKVEAWGSVPLTYRWRRNGTNLNDSVRVSGTQSNLLFFAPVLGQDAGAYDLVVQNAYGSITSSIAAVSVTASDPALVWTNPLPIPYGTLLSATQLNATSSQAGAFAYTPGFGGRLDAGTNILRVRFIPADPATYNAATTSVSIVVTPAPLAVTANNATRLRGYSNPDFTGTISGLQNADYITAIYTCVATNDSLPGTYPIQPSLFDPFQRLGNYSVTYIPGTLTVTYLKKASLPPGCVGWWKAEGDTTDRINGNDGILHGGVTYEYGKVGDAFRFDGSNSYVEVPDSPALQSAQVSIEAWVRFDSLDNSNSSLPGLQYLMFKPSANTNTEAYSLSKWRTAQGEVFRFVIGNSSGQRAVVLSTTSITRGLWYHVAGTYDGQTAKLYVNGALERSQSANFPLDYANAPLQLGGGSSSDGVGPLAGSLDEPAGYNVPLSDGDVAAIAGAGTEGKRTHAPPVIFAVNAGLSYSALFSDGLLEAPFEETGEKVVWNKSSPADGREVSSGGIANDGSVDVWLHSRLDISPSKGTWTGYGGFASVAVWVRGQPGTQYFVRGTQSGQLDATVEGSLSSLSGINADFEGNHASSGSAMHVPFEDAINIPVAVANGPTMTYNGETYTYAYTVSGHAKTLATQQFCICERDGAHIVGDATVRMQFTAGLLQPKLQITPNPVDFGKVTIRNAKPMDVVIKNIGDENSILQGVVRAPFTTAISDPVNQQSVWIDKTQETLPQFFTLEGANSSIYFNLRAGESITIKIAFAAYPDLLRYRWYEKQAGGKLPILSDDPESPSKRVDLAGFIKGPEVINFQKHRMSADAEKDHAFGLGVPWLITAQLVWESSSGVLEDLIDARIDEQLLAFEGFIRVPSVTYGSGFAMAALGSFSGEVPDNWFDNTPRDISGILRHFIGEQQAAHGHQGGIFDDFAWKSFRRNSFGNWETSRLILLQQYFWTAPWLSERQPLKRDVISFEIFEENYGWVYRGCTAAIGCLTPPWFLDTPQCVGISPPDPVSSGGNITTQFYGSPGSTFQIQRASALNGTWQTIGSVVSSNGLFNFVDTNPPPSSAFYRLRQQ